MIGEHEMADRLLDISQSDWNDLIEYTSDTDADSSGCGPAMYDGSDGPREHDEEELMSPPNLPNGGGGGSVGDTCPDEWSYDSWDECRLYHDYETCADLCFGDYEESEIHWSCVAECLLEDCLPHIANMVSPVDVPGGSELCQICSVTCYFAYKAMVSKKLWVSCGICMGTQVGVCMVSCTY